MVSISPCWTLVFLRCIVTFGFCVFPVFFLTRTFCSFAYQNMFARDCGNPLAKGPLRKVTVLKEAEQSGTSGWSRGCHGRQQHRSRTGTSTSTSFRNGESTWQWMRTVCSLQLVRQSWKRGEFGAESATRYIHQDTWGDGTVRGHGLPEIGVTQ